MAESYREMEARHEALDHQEERQEWYDRWAGRGEGPIVTEPAAVQNCINCRHAICDLDGYWNDPPTSYRCSVLNEFVFGNSKVDCGGRHWAPVIEEKISQNVVTVHREESVNLEIARWMKVWNAIE